MAALLKLLLPILSLALSFLLLSTHSATAAAAASFLADDDEAEEYILDAPFSGAPRLRSRFLASVIKKGKRCDAVSNNVCNGVSANNGTSLLYCCKKHCRNVLGDVNNCGACGRKCGFGQRCCGGACTDVVYNPLNCGKCTKACLPGVPCNYGSCGYA
ncbi:PREDICTED: protein GRIM REAPER [Ipomoea nil]|uniref:protein GRIM REAPER n=1 Tax=Ipomoea nil TaxID=35883 RepID=UPI000900DA78|nr:PREDICTED: protein GRIM REAPER [Ipomoea nil]